MNVWIMNLLDNRAEEDKPKDLQKSKFQFCKERGIIGIGWVGSDPENSEDIGFLRAYNAISAFRKDDLVWTKDPDSKEYYICRVTGEALSASGAELNQHDISKFCPCEFIAVGEEEKLPSGILKDDLISRTAISKANSTVSEITQAYVNTRNSPAPPVLQAQTASIQSIGNPSTQEKKKPNIKKIVRILIIPLLILAIIRIGVSVYKGIATNMYPLLPYSLEFGRSLTDPHGEILRFNEEVENKARKTVTGTKNLSELSIKNTEHFYPRLSIPLQPENPGSITYVFNTELDALQVVRIDLYTSAESSQVLDEFIEYYKKSLKTHGDASIQPASNQYTSNIYIITCGEYQIGIYAYEAEAMEKYDFPSISITIIDNIYVLEPHIVSDQAITDALNNANYSINSNSENFWGGGFSIKLSTLLNRCASGYQISKTPYLDTDPDLIPSSWSDALECGEYAEYLSSSYIVQIKGDLMRNPEIPYFVNEDVNILTLLLIFDENDNFIEMEILEEHPDLRTCALICVTR